MSLTSCEWPRKFYLWSILMTVPFFTYSIVQILQLHKNNFFQEWLNVSISNSLRPLAYSIVQIRSKPSVIIIGLLATIMWLPNQNGKVLRRLHWKVAPFCSPYLRYALYFLSGRECFWVCSTIMSINDLQTHHSIELHWAG